MQEEKESSVSDEAMNYLPKWQKWLWSILKAIEKRKNASKSSLTNARDNSPE